MIFWKPYGIFSAKKAYRVTVTLLCVLVAVFCVSGCASLARQRASRPVAAEPEQIIRAEEITILPPQKTLPVGERLVYGISWLGVPVGTITSHIKEVAAIKGREAYHIELMAQTNAFCSAIYRIDDRFETYIDTRTLLPLRHQLRRREGRHKKDYIVEYDHANGKATYHNLREGWTRAMDIPKDAQDPLSGIYYFRTLDVRLGDRLHMVVNMNEKNYDVYGEIEKKTIVEVPRIGIYDAFESRPYALLEGKPVKKGRAWAYVSCDESRIPLCGVVDVWVRLIGRVALTLHTRHEGRGMRDEGRRRPSSQ